MRFSGTQQGSDPLAALVGVVTLRFAALSISGEGLAAQLRTALHDDSRSDLGRIHLPDLLDFYGTARGRWRMRAAPEAAFLPGFAPVSYGTATG